MNLCTSVFVYVGSIGLYKRIVNADTQSIRIANADGQGWARRATNSNSAVCRSLRGMALIIFMLYKIEKFECFACIFGQTPSPVRVLPLIQEGEFFSLLFNMLL